MTKRLLIVVALAPLLGLAFLAALALAQPASAGPTQAAGWVTLMQEGFEGPFPSAKWHIGREGDPYLWGQRNCDPHGGTYSMWGGGGGSLGAQTPCGGMYTAGYATTLSYGPFDLSGASHVRVNFAHWTKLGAGDALGVGFSNDGGVSWDIKPMVGDFTPTCGGWCEVSWGEEQWKIALAGRPKVYLVFRFASNAAGVSYGAFVDDVSLEAYYAGAPKRLYLPLLRR